MEWAELCNDAKNNAAAREELLQVSMAEIARIAGHVAGKTLTWGNDDELSIGLIAFNEAIDTYDAAMGKSFWGYAGLVIKHRLLDYYRREGRWQKNTTLTVDGDGINPEVLQREAALAWQNLRQEEETANRAEMVLAFEKALLEFNISLAELTKSSPKHRDTRERLLDAAQALVREGELAKKFFHSKQLPIKELMLLTGQSRKVLERGRRYLVALILILARPEFSPLKEFLQLGRR